MQRQKNKFPEGGIMPIHDPERMAVIERLRQLKQGEFIINKPYKRKRKMKEKAIDFLEFIVRVIATILLLCLGFVITIICCAIVLSPIWLPALVVYLIMK